MPDEINVNHYKFWRARHVVRLTVGGTTWETEIGSIEYLGNPTTKRRDVTEQEEPIVKGGLHLVAYRIRPHEPPQASFTLGNQFGASFEWQLGPAELLLVPAAKEFAPASPDGAPPRETHYVCYRAGGPIVTEPVTLRDQFDEDRNTTERIQRLEPKYLGLPARKNDEEIGDETSILAIYDIAPRERPEPRFNIRTLDQFGMRDMAATESWMLAVPSWRVDG